MLHDADGFLTQLTRLLDQSRTKGAVTITIKRCKKTNKIQHHYHTTYHTQHVVHDLHDVPRTRATHARTPSD